MTSSWIKGYKAVAEYFGVHKATIISWVKDGMPCHKKGSWIFFNKEEIDKWMLSHGRVSA